MAQTWYIWLYSTNTKVTLDDNSEAALSSLPVEAQTVEEPVWLKVEIEAMHPDEKPIGSPTERMGGFMLHPVSQAQTYGVRSAPFGFPDDMDDLRKLRAIHRGKRYVWACMDGNGQAEATKYPDRFHVEGKAVCCSFLNPKTGHDDKAALKEYEFTLRRLKPLP